MSARILHGRASTVGLVTAVVLLTLGAVSVPAHLGTKQLSEADESQPAAQNSPLAMYLGFGYHTEQEDAAREEAERQQEKYKSDCMAEAGFDYWPEMPVVVTSDGEVGDQESADRNDRYRADLAPEELSEYWKTLNGRGPLDGVDDVEMSRIDANGNARIDFSERVALGCSGAAFVTHPGIARVVAELGPQLAAMEGRIAESREVVDGREAWAECMNRRGYSGESVMEVQKSQSDAIVRGSLTPDTYGSIEPCNQHVRDGFARARAIEEARFFDENREVIERYAVKAGESTEHSQ